MDEPDTQARPPSFSALVTPTISLLPAGPTTPRTFGLPASACRALQRLSSTRRSAELRVLRLQLDLRSSCVSCCTSRRSTAPSATCWIADRRRGTGYRNHEPDRARLAALDRSCVARRLRPPVRQPDPGSRTPRPRPRVRLQAPARPQPQMPFYSSFVFLLDVLPRSSPTCDAVLSLLVVRIGAIGRAARGMEHPEDPHRPRSAVLDAVHLVRWKMEARARLKRELTARRRARFPLPRRCIRPRRSYGCGRAPCSAGRCPMNCVTSKQPVSSLTRYRNVRSLRRIELGLVREANGHLALSGSPPPGPPAPRRRERAGPPGPSFSTA